MSSLSPAEEDAQEQSAVLHHLLDCYPAALSLDEVARELLGEPQNFTDRDSIERAVVALTRAGLLHQRDRFVTPTRAAAHFHALPSP
jgi:hypothetical protein